jgi:hypothetical protein
MTDQEEKIRRFKILMAFALSDDSLHQAEIALLNDYAACHEIPIDVQRAVLLDPESVLSEIEDAIHVDLHFLVDLAKMVLADDVVEDAEFDMLSRFVAVAFPEADNDEGISHLLIEWVSEGMTLDEIKKEFSDGVAQ